MNSLLDTLKHLGPARIGIMGGILVGLMIFFIFVSVRMSSPEMKLLYKDLSSIDSGAIAGKLEEAEIRYEISGDGARITVPASEVGRARMLLAAEGLPNGGSLGYELFDEKPGFGTTNFVQNINQVRALEGELAKTITSLDKIRSARVHLVLPQRELFSRESRSPSASVFLGVVGSGKPDRTQILAIQSLVSSAVPELKSSNVSIIDNNGNLLAKGDDDDVNMMSLKAEELRRNFESNLMQKIEDQVSRIVGFGKVRAIVTAEMNFDRISTSEELYDPEGQVVRSTQTTEENNLEREPPPEDVSVQNNLPGVGGDLLIEQQPSLESNRIEEVTNFEISRTTRSTITEGGEVEKLSVSVLVDGIYARDEEGNETYTERSEAEMERITALVVSAIGLDRSRGDTIEVVNLPFAQVDTNEEMIDDNLILGFNKADLLDTAEIMTIAIMIVLVVLLILQPMVSRLLAAEGQTLDEDLEADLLAARPDSPALAGPSDEELGADGQEGDNLIDLQGVEGKVKASSIKRVEEIVDNYPNETVSVIRSWMTQES